MWLALQGDRITQEYMTLDIYCILRYIGGITALGIVFPGTR